ncbi:hypothetical protein [Couchioplanes caeruleus]|uniref:N-acetyltransferase domain-containing protein n=2 Tax=Couchioplanes caeruleus TaxID=56438 RepID=A0A1K0GS03_9ACTN|nr:hypothetical protein [Couchioplanes caeruleus]OJF15214.1 hypothetical protein BG844_05790 [Couchioplanes caeruleus subsp. caeruleus]ROP28004.1 hypothetical protein EDD30_0707 [Couchioplanes caeruleus]
MLQRLRDAGADRDEQAAAQFATRLREEMFPEPEPFTWANRVAPERRWQRRVWVHARLRWRRQPPPHPGAHQLLLLRLGAATVGRLDYQVCDQCRCGYVRQLDVSDRYRGLGLGTRAIRVARRGRDGYRWSTTAQYPTNGTFWAAVRLPEDHEGACPHMQRP